MGNVEDATAHDQLDEEEEVEYHPPPSMDESFVGPALARSYEIPAVS